MAHWENFVKRLTPQTRRHKMLGSLPPQGETANLAALAEAFV